MSCIPVGLEAETIPYFTKKVLDAVERSRTKLKHEITACKQSLSESENSVDCVHYEKKIENFVSRLDCLEAKAFGLRSMIDKKPDSMIKLSFEDIWRLDLHKPIIQKETPIAPVTTEEVAAN